jgi:hypothetical protein
VTKYNNTDFWTNPKTAAITLGIGVLLAPFTAGASLVQAAGTVGIAMAIKASENNKPKA